MTIVDRGGRQVTIQPEAVSGTNPAANAEFSHTVPAGETWLLKGVTVQNVQAGAGASQPVLQITVGGVVVFESYGCTTTQAISTTCRYSWAPGNVISGLIGATTGVRAVAPLPADLVLPAGSVIASVTIGLSASTDFGAPAFLVEKL